MQRIASGMDKVRPAASWAEAAADARAANASALPDFDDADWSRFAHAVYRCAALLKFAIEKRQPSRLQLGSD